MKTTKIFLTIILILIFIMLIIIFGTRERVFTESPPADYTPVIIVDEVNLYFFSTEKSTIERTAQTITCTQEELFDAWKGLQGISSDVKISYNLYGVDNEPSISTFQSSDVMTKEPFMEYLAVVEISKNFLNQISKNDVEQVVLSLKQTLLDYLTQKGQDNMQISFQINYV